MKGIIFAVMMYAVIKLFTSDVLFRMGERYYALVVMIFFDFSLTVKAAPHACVIRTGQP